MSGHTVRATFIVGDYSAKVTLDVDARYCGGSRQKWAEPGEPAGYSVAGVELDDVADLFGAIAAYLNDRRAEAIAEAMELRAEAQREDYMLRGES